MDPKKGNKQVKQNLFFGDRPAAKSVRRKILSAMGLRPSSELQRMCSHLSVLELGAIHTQKAERIRQIISDAQAMEGDVPLDLFEEALHKTGEAFYIRKVLSANGKVMVRPPEQFRAFRKEHDDETIESLGEKLKKVEEELSICTGLLGAQHLWCRHRLNVLHRIWNGMLLGTELHCLIRERRDGYEYHARPVKDAERTKE
jgi:hypothetical protein